MTSQPQAIPPARYIGSEHVMGVMASHGTERLDRLDPLRVLAMAVLAGGFITAGALFSILLASGTRNEGAVRLLEGFGFSTGFFFVILSGAILFTETNVVLPAVLIRSRSPLRHVLRFWGLAWLDNLLGAALFGALIAAAIDLGPSSQALLNTLVDAKLAAARAGTLTAWLSVVVSGVLANWLVGMAAFFATMGRTILGKYIPVLLAVTLFVSAGFQHSPANMGYFSLSAWLAEAPDWSDVIWWNLVPAGIGNIIGGGLGVAVLLGWAYSRYDAPSGGSL